MNQQALERIGKLLTALAGVVAVVPGAVALTSGFGSPPGSRGIFGLALEVVGAGALVSVLMRRNRSVFSPGWGILSALVLIIAYFIAFDTAVQKHQYYATETHVLIPFLTPQWAPPQLDTIVACARQQRCAGVLPDYHAEDVAHAITRYGPDTIDPLIPPWWRRLTIVVLFILYAGCVGLLVVSFGSWARQLTQPASDVPSKRESPGLGVRK